jgi:hypothetical protein
MTLSFTIMGADAGCDRAQRRGRYAAERPFGRFLCVDDVGAAVERDDRLVG